MQSSSNLKIAHTSDRPSQQGKSSKFCRSPHGFQQTNLPYSSNAQFASLNEMVHQPYPSPRMKMSPNIDVRGLPSPNHPSRPLLPKVESPKGSVPFPSPRNSREYDGYAPFNPQGYANVAFGPTVYSTNSHPIHTSHSHVPPTSSNNRWAQARDYRRQVHEPPQIGPEDDNTITEVQQNAEFWVGQLALAMANTFDVKDTETSHARRMFLPENYDPLLIEATCREIFTSLIDRCKHGFRGPAHFNKALKPNKDLEADKNATCEERVQNVVQVLTWNKRVCKDVLWEDWKIRLLVNHPLAYDKEKDSQKGSNDQRRVRLQMEREKLKKTEEELKVYQETNQQIDAHERTPTEIASGPTYDARAPIQSWSHEWVEIGSEESLAQVAAYNGSKRQQSVEEGLTMKRQKL